MEHQSAETHQPDIFRKNPKMLWERRTDMKDTGQLQTEDSKPLQMLFIAAGLT